MPLATAPIWKDTLTWMDCTEYSSPSSIPWIALILYIVNGGVMHITPYIGNMIANKVLLQIRW